MNGKSIKILTVLICLLAFPVFCLNALSQDKNQINVVTINNDVINPVINEYIKDAIEFTARNNHQALVIKIDTPGGLLESTRDIVKNILNSDVPVVVFVSPAGGRAASAGFFILISSHIAVMAPSTNTGSAHPVAMGIGAPKMDGEKDKDKKPSKADSQDTMGEKVLNDTIAWVTTIAQTRGRNVDWAVKAVTESDSYTEKEALKRGLIDHIAEDVPALLLKIDNSKLKIKDSAFTLNTSESRLNYISLKPQQRVLNSLINPTIAYLLLLFGFLGLMFEFTHPGIGFPGIAGAIALLFAFYAFQMLPVNYAGIGLMILAIILFVAEAFTPSFGLLTLGGIVSLTLGSLMLFKSPLPFFQLSLSVIIPVVLSVSIISLFLITNIIRAHKRKVSSGPEALIGKEAVAYTDITNKGKVFFDGEIWNAKAAEKIDKGSEVIIQERKGLTLLVKKKQLPII